MHEHSQNGVENTLQIYTFTNLHIFTEIKDPGCWLHNYLTSVKSNLILVDNITTACFYLYILYFVFNFSSISKFSKKLRLIVVQMFNILIYL